MRALSVASAEAKDIPSEPYVARATTLKLDRDWHVPCVEVTLKGKTPHRVAIVVADGGRTAAESLVGDLLNEDHRVMVMDMLFTGECVPGKGFAAWTYAMLVANSGERPLGLQVAQVMAVVDYAARTSPGRPITVAGAGRVASVVAVLAAALAERNRPQLVIARGLPASLKQLIEKRIGYTAAAPLFCFGLLREVDVCEMLAMALPAKLKLTDVEGGADRIHKALSPFMP